MADIYWEYTILGEESEEEYPMASLAAEAAEAAWVEYITNNCEPSNGQVWEDTAVLTSYTISSGKKVDEEDYEVSYEHYHGDKAEHFNQKDFL